METQLNWHFFETVKRTAMLLQCNVCVSSRLDLILSWSRAAKIRIALKEFETASTVAEMVDLGIA
jgi:hypothetical protein